MRDRETRDRETRDRETRTGKQRRSDERWFLVSWQIHMLPVPSSDVGEDMRRHFTFDIADARSEAPPRQVRPHGWWGGAYVTSSDQDTERRLGIPCATVSHQSIERELIIDQMIHNLYRVGTFPRLSSLVSRLVCLSSCLSLVLFVSRLVRLSSCSSLVLFVSLLSALFPFLRSTSLAVLFGLFRLAVQYQRTHT